LWRLKKKKKKKKKKNLHYLFCCPSRWNCVQKLGESFYVWLHSMFIHLFK
jgi:hypothetical protein